MTLDGMVAAPGCILRGFLLHFAVWLSICPVLAAGHGYLIEPSSRNLLRYNLELEHCPHCLQSGGPNTVKTRGNNTWPSIDAPGSHGLCGDPGQDQPVPLNIAAEIHMHPMHVQREYVPGSVAEFRIGLTAHHKGHYEFRICDRGLDGSKLASHAEGQECLNTWVLERAQPDPTCAPNGVADCQPLDPNHPERWYVPPPGLGTPVAGLDWKDSDAKPWPNVYELHHARFKIPQNLTCTHCTLQWYYATGNTCLFDCDYLNYFRKVFAPAGWDASAWVMFAMQDWATCENTVCGPRGNGQFGEEFWNCADVAVLPAGPTQDPTPWPTVFPTSMAPTSTPVPTIVSTPLPTERGCVDGVLPAAWGRPCGAFETSGCAENPVAAFCVIEAFNQHCCFCGGGTIETPMPTHPQTPMPTILPTEPEPEPEPESEPIPESEPEAEPESEPTSVPTPMRTPIPTDPSGCVDAVLPGAWGGGGAYTCTTYEDIGIAAGRPTVYCAHDEIMKACCFCGGGSMVTMVSMPAAAPTGAPVKWSRLGPFLGTSLMQSRMKLTRSDSDHREGRLGGRGGKL